MISLPLSHARLVHVQPLTEPIRFAEEAEWPQGLRKENSQCAQPRMREAEMEHDPFPWHIAAVFFEVSPHVVSVN